MKNLKNILGLLFLAVAFVGQPLYSLQAQAKGVNAFVKRVDKEMSLLDRIVEQVDIIVDGTDQEARTQARKELKKLMESEELDAKIKDAIKDDIKIIKSPRTTTRRRLYDARIRLLDTYAEIDSQANLVEAIAHATKMVENASPEELDAVLLEAKEIIEKAEDEQQGTLGRWYTKAKRMVTSQVNYVFGEESSYAKTAFYAAAGVALLAAGAYVGLHGIDKIKEYRQDPPLMLTMQEWTPQFKASIKEKFGDDPEVQKEGLREMLKDLEPKKILLEKERNLLKKEYSALEKQSEKLIEQEKGLRSEGIINQWNDVGRKKESVWKELLEKDRDLMQMQDYYDYHEYLTNPKGRVRVWKTETFEGQPVENNVPKQSTIGTEELELKKRLDSWEKKRFALNKEADYWREQIALADDGKREPLTEKEQRDIKEFEKVYENIRWNERDIEDTLRKKGWWRF